MTGNRPSIVVISSHVARGSVGNRAIVHALQLEGFDVWALPTIILPWHPGHGPATRIVPPIDQFAAFMRDLADGPFSPGIAAVISGYLGVAGQADVIAAFVSALKARNGAMRYLCDPVIGDQGGLYVPDETAKAIRDRLVPLADIVTPNIHEFSWLNGLDATADASALVAQARRMAAGDVVITSAGNGRDTGNLLVTGEAAWRFSHPFLDDVPSGTGDLTAALILAGLLAGETSDAAVLSATAGVIDCLEKTRAAGSDELVLPRRFANSSAVINRARVD